MQVPIVYNRTFDVPSAYLIRTGVMNKGVNEAPSIYELGREYTELKKVKGRWLISADRGLPRTTPTPCASRASIAEARIVSTEPLRARQLVARQVVGFCK